MAVHPILFSAPMVRALIAGTKTQTRRLLPKLTPYEGHHPGDPERWRFGNTHSASIFASDDDVREYAPASEYMPYRVGDLLWVREAWGFNPDHPTVVEFGCYRADPGHEHDGIKWRPSIHMPRAASRLTLTVSDVRVQRLQGISEDDARAEGCWTKEAISITALREQVPLLAVHPSMVFRHLWDGLHGPDAWDANPWIVALTFRCERRNIDAPTLSSDRPDAE